MDPKYKPYYTVMPNLRRFGAVFELKAAVERTRSKMGLVSASLLFRGSERDGDIEVVATKEIFQFETIMSIPESMCIVGSREVLMTEMM